MSQLKSSDSLDIHFSVASGSLSNLKALLARGADVNARNAKGDTPLHLATQIEDREIIAVLVARGADTEARNQNGDTPLHVAVRGDHVGGVERLLVYGVDIHAVDGSGETAMGIALERFRLSVVRRISAYYSKTGTGTSDAPSDVGISVIQLLIEHGYNVNRKFGEAGKTTLHRVAERFPIEVLSAILDAGADLEITQNDGQTALHVATGQDRADAVELLLRRGADNAARLPKGFTPLHVAARVGAANAARVLIHGGAPLDYVDELGFTALHVVSHYGHLEIARQLLRSGGDPNIRSVKGLTALTIALLQNKHDVARCLIEAGADINRRGAHDATPLHLAASSEDAELVQLMLAHGADVNAQHPDIGTPLDVAARQGTAVSKTIMGLLTARGGVSQNTKTARRPSSTERCLTVSFPDALFCQPQEEAWGEMAWEALELAACDRIPSLAVRFRNSLSSDNAYMGRLEIKGKQLSIRIMRFLEIGSKYASPRDQQVYRDESLKSFDFFQYSLDEARGYIPKATEEWTRQFGTERFVFADVENTDIALESFQHLVNAIEYTFQELKREEWRVQDEIWREEEREIERGAGCLREDEDDEFDW